MADQTSVRSRRSLVSLGVMLLLSGAAVMTAGFALPLEYQKGALGQIAMGLAGSGAVIYLAGLYCRHRTALRRQAEAAAAEAQANATEARAEAPGPVANAA